MLKLKQNSKQKSKQKKKKTFVTNQRKRRCYQCNSEQRRVQDLILGAAQNGTGGLGSILTTPNPRPLPSPPIGVLCAVLEANAFRAICSQKAV